MIDLREYQEEHIINLCQMVNKFLKQNYSKICVFKSPTGSGKTIMMAEVIKRIVEEQENKKEIAFVWITVHKLHEQSKTKLKKYYDDSRIITCSSFDDLRYAHIHDREILFCNWHSVNKKKNIIIRENENGLNLSSVIKNTKEGNRDIILIIDESHYAAGSYISKEIIQQINPKITIEVSATPKILERDYLEEVQLKEVQRDQMIKKTVRLNYKLDKNSVDDIDNLILKTALEKRQKLKELYEKEGSNVNPLVLIQIPNRDKSIYDKKNETIELLNTFGINTDNGKLAIYLSNDQDKKNLNNIEKNDNDVEVLIFKQAIAVGWDCPRSSILVLFRELSNIIFSIQIIGRIMRMPEQRFYKNDELNHAHIYANIKDVMIVEDIVKDYMTIYESIRRDELNDNVDLESIYITREHGKTRLNKLFTDVFRTVAREYKLAKRITISRYFKSELLIDAEITELDKPQNVMGSKMSGKISEDNMQKIFDYFLIKHTNGFAPLYSSGRINYAIYDFFDKYFNINTLFNIQKLVMVKVNKKHFVHVIDASIEKYRKDVVKKLKEDNVENISKWNIPQNIEYTKVHEELDCEKCIMKPVYIRTNNRNERDFINFLEKKNSVKWWFKNEDRDKKYFAILYERPNDDIPHGFYVDFVIRMKDGRIGLFDTKSGITAETAKPKAEVLSKYIKENKHKKLFGGIAVFDGTEWRYNDKEVYEYKNNLSGWGLINLD